MKLVDQNPCLPLFHKPIIYTKLACWKMLQHFTGEPMFSSIHFPIYNIRMEQTWKENTAIYNYALFQKFLLKDWSTYS